MYSAHLFFLIFFLVRLTLVYYTFLVGTLAYKGSTPDSLGSTSRGLRIIRGEIGEIILFRGILSYFVLFGIFIHHIRLGTSKNSHYRWFGTYIIFFLVLKSTVTVFLTGKKSH